MVEEVRSGWARPRRKEPTEDTQGWSGHPMEGWASPRSSRQAALGTDAQPGPQPDLLGACVTSGFPGHSLDTGLKPLGRLLCSLWGPEGDFLDVPSNPHGVQGRLSPRVRPRWDCGGSARQGSCHWACRVPKGQPKWCCPCFPICQSGRARGPSSVPRLPPPSYARHSAYIDLKPGSLEQLAER